MAKITDKINEIETYIAELEPVLPSDLEQYLSNIMVKATCERYFEKIIEAVIDLAFLVARKTKLGPPEDDEGIFKVLSANNIIPDVLAKRLKDAKGMRNIIVHEYGKINDALVFEAVTEELARDVRDFIVSVKKSI